MLPRPKPGESEEDLLRFQQEFLKSQTTSSASVVKKPDKRKSEEGLGECVRDKVKMEGLPAVAGPSIPHPLIPKKKTRFQAEVEERREQVSLMEDPEERLDKQDTHMAAVLTKILERDTQNAPVNMPTRCSKGFPTVLHRGQQDKSGSAGGGRKSLFAMQVSKMSPKDFGLMVEQETTKLKLDKPSIDAASSAKVSETPVVIEGSGLSATFGSEEAKKIHEENLQKLHSMSEEEILAEKQKLLQMLDPKVVSFLKSKRTSKSVDTQMEDVAPENADLHRRKETPMEVLMDKSELPVKPNKEWVHMDQVEYDKMSWMKDLPTPKAGDSQTGQQARFDFHGNLISSSADIPVNVGLHHHGDEPERAGYTLEELFHLSRSTNIQQRCLALKTIANLLRNARNNALESLIQSPLLPVVLDAGIIFLLRWSLDDQVDAVVIHAISSLHALLVCQADEQALDRAFPWFQGHTSPSHKPVEESQEMTSPQNIDEEKPQETDADVLKKDVLLCLVTRMNILPRLKYILVKVRPQAPVVIEILEILTRIARHSPNLAYEIERHTGLLELIVEEFLPTSWRLLGRVSDSELDIKFQ